MSGQSHAALQSFNLANDVFNIEPQDQIYHFDSQENKEINKAHPWSRDPNYFKSVKISAVALIKMVIHARSGGIWEIMGLMQGKVQGDCIVILDSFALPVQGTETRVNAASEANEYMVAHLEQSQQAGRMEPAIGWYHSHPGYGCWLSGIDVDTQSQNQQYQDPWVAVVIDPNRTVSAGKVDIGAFRTFPEDYKPSSNSAQAYQSIPLNKIEDFGVHAERYYQLPITIFKSSLDDKLLGLLWNKYWVGTLSQSPLISNRSYAVSQTLDLAEKLSRASSSVNARGGPAIALPVRQNTTSMQLGMAGGKPAPEKEKKVEDTALGKVVRDSNKIASEAQHGLIAQVLKDMLFSSRPGHGIEVQSGTGLLSGPQSSSMVEERIDMVTS